jgi:hypothetical protein
MANPAVGDIVLHKNGCRAEVMQLGSIMTKNGMATIYNIKFLNGNYVGVNCLREEFKFPPPMDAA